MDTNEFYVGVSDDPKYPGIISGPFPTPPALAEGDFLYVKSEGKFVLI